MKRLVLAFVCAVIVISMVGYAFRERLTLRLMSRVVAQNMGTDLVGELPDGLHVAVCGAGSPLPDPARSGPCVAVIAGDEIFVVDSGSGSSRILSRMRVPQGAIEGVMLTHFHSDHIDGLGELMLMRWVNGGHVLPTPIHGPAGVEQVVEGLNQAYAQDFVYRFDHHGGDVVPQSGAGGEPRPFAMPEIGESVTLIDRDGLRVVAFAVDHEPVRPAVGYRFDYAGRSVLLSGDTTKSSNVELFAKDVDLLIHEALSPELVGILTQGAESAGRKRLAKVTRDILDYHATPMDAAEVARDADVGFLLYYHTVPPLLLAPMEGIFLEGVSDVYEGPVRIARDGTLVSLPAGTDAIDVRSLF